jgi:hypothetical protein
VARTVARLVQAPVAPANPYWAAHGMTVEDPDGFRVVLVPERWTVDNLNAADRSPVRTRRLRHRAAR